MRIKKKPYLKEYGKNVGNGNCIKCSKLEQKILVASEMYFYDSSPYGFVSRTYNLHST
jgi:hypothetical protein